MLKTPLQLQTNVQPLEPNPVPAQLHKLSDLPILTAAHTAVEPYFISTS